MSRGNRQRRAGFWHFRASKLPENQGENRVKSRIVAEKQENGGLPVNCGWKHPEKHNIDIQTCISAPAARRGSVWSVPGEERRQQRGTLKFAHHAQSTRVNISLIRRFTVLALVLTTQVCFAQARPGTSGAKPGKDPCTRFAAGSTVAEPVSRHPQVAWIEASGP